MEFSNSLAINACSDNGCNLAGISSFWTAGLSRKSLQDRFRGALLGLSLVSVNASSRLLSTVPGLLRHHSSWQRRQRWIVSWLSSFSGQGSCGQLLTVQMLVLGDLLSLFLSESALNGGVVSSVYSDSWFRGDDVVAHLSACRDQYDLLPEQQRYYQKVLADIAAELGGKMPNAVASTSSVTASEVNPMCGEEHDAFVGGVACALRCPQSYGVAVQMSVAYGPMAPAIAGLLVGAAGGQSSLPLLWQLKSLDTGSIQRCADGLFRQWAGVLPVAEVS